MTHDIHEDSLTMIERYPFTDLGMAREFVNTMRQIDNRVLSANLELTAY